MAALNEKMGGLEGSWLVTEVADATLPPDAQIRIHFGDGRVWGRAACRSFSGSIDVSGDSFFLGELKRGHEECAPELMEAEDQFMRAFEVTNRFVIADNGVLQFFALDFPKVTARPAAAP